MDKISSYINYGILFLGVFTVLGGMFFRKTFAVIRNIVLSPIMGFSLALLLFVPKSATGIFQHVFNTVTLVMDAKTLKVLTSGIQILSDLGVAGTASDFFFITASIISSILLALAVALPIRSRFYLNIESMIVSAFIVTLGTCMTFSVFKADFSTLAFFIVFLALSILLPTLQKYDFDLVLIVETSILGSMLLLSPVKMHLGLAFFIYMIFVILLAAILVIIGISLKARKDNR